MIIAPSLLAADLGHLESEIKKIDRSGADWFHLDVMDGIFVPNLSFGPDFLRLIKQHSDLPCDAHLMCSKPEIVLDHFIKEGAGNITVHAELGEHAVDLLWKIRAAGCTAGIAINPPTPFEVVKPFLKHCDLLLIMTVNPGYGGQVFIEETLQKITLANKWRRDNGNRFHLQVDGGINFETAGECAACGADNFVSGTTIFKYRGYKAAVNKLRKSVEYRLLPLQKSEEFGLS